MKNFTKFSGAAVLALALVQPLHAIPVDGNIGFTGAVILNTSSAATASAVTTWINPVVNLRDGAFSVIPNATAVTFTAPWTFNTGVSPLWTVSFGGETFTFNLLVSTIQAQGGTPGTTGFVVIQGSGTVSGTGNTAYDPTVMNWSFTTQDPSITTGGREAWTFSASTTTPPPPVPDGASTALLLGAALSGIALIKRKFMA